LVIYQESVRYVAVTKVTVRIKRTKCTEEENSNKNGKCQNHNFVAHDVSLETFAATEFNVMFWGRVCRRLEPSHQEHHEDGDGFSSRSVGKPSHLEAAVCPRRLN